MIKPSYPILVPLMIQLTRNYKESSDETAQRANTMTTGFAMQVFKFIEQQAPFTDGDVVPKNMTRDSIWNPFVKSDERENWDYASSSQYQTAFAMTETDWNRTQTILENHNIYNYRYMVQSGLWQGMDTESLYYANKAATESKRRGLESLRYMYGSSVQNLPTPTHGLYNMHREFSSPDP